MYVRTARPAGAQTAAVALPPIGLAGLWAVVALLGGCQANGEHSRPATAPAGERAGPGAGAGPDATARSPSDAATAGAAAAPRLAAEVDDPQVRKNLVALGLRDADKGRILGLTVDVDPSPGEERVYAVGVGGLAVLAGDQSREPGALLHRAEPQATSSDSLVSLLAVQALPDPAWELLLEGFRGGSGGGALEMSLWKVGQGGTGLHQIWHGRRGEVRFIPGGLEHRPLGPAGNRSEPSGSGAPKSSGPRSFVWNPQRFRFEPKEIR